MEDIRKYETEMHSETNKIVRASSSSSSAAAAAGGAGDEARVDDIDGSNTDTAAAQTGFDGEVD